MGKKGKKSRFNQVLDIDINYSSNSVLEGGSAIPSDIQLSKEKLSELQRIKAQLPSAPQAVRLEEDIARLPDTGPFRMVLNNVPFSAQRKNIEEFFLPIEPLQVRIVDDAGQNRGFCYVEFASKADLQSAMEKNNTFLLNRRVTMRIADQGGSGGRQNFGGRDEFGRRGDSRGGAEPGGWTRRTVTAGSAGIGAESRGWNRGAALSSTAPGASATGAWQRRAPTNGHPATAASSTEGESVPARPIINLKPRTKPKIDLADEFVDSPRNAAIFGGAKPVDILARERMQQSKLASEGNQAAPVEETSSEVPTSIKSDEVSKPQLKNPPRQNAWSKPLITSTD